MNERIQKVVDLGFALSEIADTTSVMLHGFTVKEIEDLQTEKGWTIDTLDMGDTCYLTAKYNYGLTLFSDSFEKTEFTLEEVAKKFNVPIERLKIKDEPRE